MLQIRYTLVETAGREIWPLAASLQWGPAEAEKLKTFRRADFCVQNFPDDKKVRKFKFCDKKGA